jgi:hypothetical protein
MISIKLNSEKKKLRNCFNRIPLKPVETVTRTKQPFTRCLVLLQNVASWLWGESMNHKCETLRKIRREGNGVSRDCTVFM